MFRITNGNDFDFIGRHNGNDYSFPKGQPVYCEDAPAAHIFGIGQPDKSAVLARHGWAAVTASIDQGLRILNAFTFEHVIPAYDAPLALVGGDDGYGPAPVDQDAPASEDGTDGSPDQAGAVEVPRRGRPPVDRLPPAV